MSGICLVAFMCKIMHSCDLEIARSLILLYYLQIRNKYNGQPNGSTIHYRISKCPYWGVLKASPGMGFSITILRIPRYLSLCKEHAKRSLTRTMSSISSNEVDLQSELVRSFLNLDRLDPNIFRYQSNSIVIAYTFFVQVIERKKTIFIATSISFS